MIPMAQPLSLFLLMCCLMISLAVQRTSGQVTIVINDADGTSSQSVQPAGVGAAVSASASAASDGMMAAAQNTFAAAVQNMQATPCTGCSPMLRGLPLMQPTAPMNFVPITDIMPSDGPTNTDDDSASDSATPATSEDTPAPQPSPAPATKDSPDSSSSSDPSYQAASADQSQQLTFTIPNLGTLLQNPFSSGSPTTTSPSSTPSTNQPAPAPTPSSSWSCSSTDTSAAAVYSCINAARTNPDAFSQQYPCTYSTWRSSVVSPRRPALKSNYLLTRSAQRQADGMASMQRVTHTGQDGTTFDQRIAQAGYKTFPQAENVAGGQRSALQVVMQWMCSEGHRSNIMSCSLDEVGTGVRTSGWTYFAQDFGCSVTNSCHC